MSNWINNFLKIMPVIWLVSGMSVSIAQADDDDESYGFRAGERKISAALAENQKWKVECGACHLAFPARFLPAESWRNIMSGLDKHFGSNATLNAEDVSEITAYLETHARTKRTYRDESGNYPLRITGTRWFKREHSEASTSAKSNSKVKSMANCSVCHLQAELGDYSEHNVKIPH